VVSAGSAPQKQKALGALPLQFPEQQSAFTTQGRFVYELGFVTQAHLPFTQFSLEQSLLDWQLPPTGATQAGVSPVVCE
jgi:hypothetical protein